MASDSFTEDEKALLDDALTSLYVRAPARRAEIKAFLEVHSDHGIEVDS